MRPKIYTNIKIKVNGATVTECSNVVTSLGIGAIVAGGFPSEIAVGTGSQKEEVSVTELNKQKRQERGKWLQEAKNKIDVIANTITNTSTLKVAFPVESENVIYTEVGIINSSKNLYTYALLRDSLGGVSSVTVLKGERLEVEYTVSYSYPYKHEGDGSSLYLLGMPRIQDIPSNINGGHDIGVYTGSNDALEGGTYPSGVSRISNAIFKKIADKLIITVPAFINRPEIDVNGIYVYPSNNNNEHKSYTYCIAFDDPKALLAKNSYECTANLPYFLKKD